MTRTVPWGLKIFQDNTIRLWYYFVWSFAGILAPSSTFSPRISGTIGHYNIMEHISDHDLERYYLGMIHDTPERDPLEEHLIGCAECVRRAEESDSYVDAMRAAMVDLVYNSHDLD